MEIEDFINASEFQMAVDETFRNEACETVDAYLNETDAGLRVRHSQIHSIQDTIRANGLRGLRELAEEQVAKNTKRENQQFWEFVHSLISRDGEPRYGKTSLHALVKKELEKKGMLEDPASVSKRPEQKRIRNHNRALVDEAMDSALATYFEHFCCHYLYKTAHR